MIVRGQWVNLAMIPGLHPYSSSSNLVFPGGLPSRYWPGSALLSFSGQPVLGCRVIWLLRYIYIYISGGPLSALTCCVNVRLLSGDKKNIAVNLFSKLGWELGLYYASYDDFHPDILARTYSESHSEYVCYPNNDKVCLWERVSQARWRIRPGAHLLFPKCITNFNLFPSQSHEKTGGKSRSTPGRMTPIPSHSRVVIFFFFFLITVNYSKNIVQITACPPY